MSYEQYLPVATAPESAGGEPYERLMSIQRRLEQPRTDTSTLIQDAYFLSLDLGRAELKRQYPGTFDDNLRNDMPHPKQFCVRNIEGWGGWFSPDQLSVNIERVQTISPDDPDTRRFVKTAGVNLSEAKLFTLLDTVGHEAGHSLSYALSQRLEEQGFTYPGDSALIRTRARSALLKQPHRGWTGNLETDERIEEERFAEGFRAFVMLNAAEELGIRKNEARYISDTLHDLNRGPSESRNIHGPHTRFDVLGQVRPDRSLAIIMVNTYWHEPTSIEAYPGSLGYAEPLSPRGIARAIRTAKQLEQDGPDRSRITNVENYGKPTLRRGLFRVIDPAQARLRRQIIKRRSLVRTRNNGPRHAT